MAVDHINFDGIFTSERLLYRAVENSPEDRAFLRDLVSDSATFAQSTNALLRPQSIEEIDKSNSSGRPGPLNLIFWLKPSPGSADLLTRVGTVSLDWSQSSRHHRQGQLGILVATPHQGKGYGTEAIRWVLDWAFGVAGLHAVRLAAFSYNARAVKLYERIGFVKEGVKRESLYYNYQWHDHILFSILDREWQALRVGGTEKSEADAPVV